MKTLIQKSGANFELATRFVFFIRERRRLEGRIRDLEADVLYYQGAVQRLELQSARKEAVIESLEKTQYVLPAGVQQLIEDAHEILKGLQRNHPVRIWPVRQWILDYIAWKREPLYREV